MQVSLATRCCEIDNSKNWGMLVPQWVSLLPLPSPSLFTCYMLPHWSCQVYVAFEFASSLVKVALTAVSIFLSLSLSHEHVCSWKMGWKVIPQQSTTEIHGVQTFLYAVSPDPPPCTIPTLFPCFCCSAISTQKIPWTFYLTSGAIHAYVPTIVVILAVCSRLLADPKSHI